MAQELVTRNALTRCPFQILSYDSAGQFGAGTGFFYSLGDERFLITNWHVVTGKDAFTREPLHPSRRLPEYLNVKLATSLDNADEFAIVSHRFDLFEDYEPRWFQHPELGSTCDVVAFPVPDSPRRPRPMHGAANAISDTPIPVAPGSTAFVVGFPMGMSIGPGLPLLKSGYIASETHYDINIGGDISDVGGLKGGLQLPAFFLDAQTRPGMSGSPVFASYTGLWDVRDPYRSLAPAEAGGLGLTDSTTFGTAHHFVGCYSGRVPERENEAILGLCWREDAIRSICESRVPGVHPHVS